MNKRCLQCQREILITYKNKHNPNKFCSKECCNKWKKGKRSSIKTEFKKGCKPWHAGKKGVKPAPSTAFKKGDIPWHIGRQGSDHPSWKGDKIGMIGVHTYMYKTYGKPTYCEHCGVKAKDTKKMCWANKGHTYRRNREDWIMLCSRCHWHFDHD